MSSVSPIATMSTGRAGPTLRYAAPRSQAGRTSAIHVRTLRSRLIGASRKMAGAPVRTSEAVIEAACAMMQRRYARTAAVARHSHVPERLPSPIGLLDPQRTRLRLLADHRHLLALHVEPATIGRRITVRMR